jgi:hypothetical protein
MFAALDRGQSPVQMVRAAPALRRTMTDWGKRGGDRWRYAARPKRAMSWGLGCQFLLPRHSLVRVDMSAP